MTGSEPQRPGVLEHLESQAIHILREVTAQARAPVLLYSIGKDSSVLLHLALKAFAPAFCKRDPKELYRKADAGELRHFTGVDAPYEAPERPDIHLRAGEGTAEEMAERVVGAIALAAIS